MNLRETYLMRCGHGEVGWYSDSPAGVRADLRMHEQAQRRACKDCCRAEAERRYLDHAPEAIEQAGEAGWPALRPLDGDPEHHTDWAQVLRATALNELAAVERCFLHLEVDHAGDERIASMRTVARTYGRVLLAQTWVPAWIEARYDNANQRFERWPPTPTAPSWQGWSDPPCPTGCCAWPTTCDTPRHPPVLRCAPEGGLRVTTLAAKPGRRLVRRPGQPR
ncbi:hypothetical protein ACWEVD_00585 [Nocardia thailandica]